MAKVWAQQEILHKADAIRWIPHRNPALSFLPLPVGVGALEPPHSGIRGPGLRPRHHRGQLALPYPDVVPWANISLSVPERDVAKLGKVLERVTATNLTAIQNNLWNDTIRRALLFNEPLQRGDATWQVLQGLTRKLSRSYRNRSTSVLLE